MINFAEMSTFERIMTVSVFVNIAFDFTIAATVLWLLSKLRRLSDSTHELQETAGVFREFKSWGSALIDAIGRSDTPSELGRCSEHETIDKIFKKVSQIP